MIFTAHDYKRLHSIVFAGNYPGFRDDVIELPNGDGKPDVGKRYAHIALKYLEQAAREGYVDRTDIAFMTACLFLAQDHAEEVARKLNVPAAFFPVIDDATLRVLEYPACVGGERHTDFDLFSLACYRNDPTHTYSPLQFDDLAVDPGQGARLQAVHPGLHLGEIAELIGVGKATPHRVFAREYVQHSIVFFAMPSHAAVLPRQPYAHAGVPVSEWLKERYARSRAYK